MDVRDTNKAERRNWPSDEDDLNNSILRSSLLRWMLLVIRVTVDRIDRSIQDLKGQSPRRMLYR